ncbi:heterodisulfide reductase-related iron-sulfur binding cluster [Streptomyces sp. NPDC057486]|uniref:heterodisulfide reductase-related iron-sulfur binding cluster n=1 Tax=Streptomyces sp. NPDC057486 TaxID=3346145 RepID=UPI00368D4171
MRIALFVTCFDDTLFPGTGRAVASLLERLGHTVEFPLEQTCCGQMHFNTGYLSDAVPLVARFARIFRHYDAVVAPSASCAAMVRENLSTPAEEYGDAALRYEVSDLVPRVHELTGFLIDMLQVTDVDGIHGPRTLDLITVTTEEM